MAHVAPMGSVVAFCLVFVGWVFGQDPAVPKIDGLKVYQIEDLSIPEPHEHIDPGAWLYQPDAEKPLTSKGSQNHFEIVRPQREPNNGEDSPFFDNVGDGVLIPDRQQILFPITNRFSTGKGHPLPLIRLFVERGQLSTIAKPATTLPIQYANRDGSRLLAFDSEPTEGRIDIVVLSLRGDSFKPLYGWRPLRAGEWIWSNHFNLVRLVGKTHAVVSGHSRRLEVWELGDAAPRVVFSTHIASPESYGVSRGGRCLAIQQEGRLSLVDIGSGKIAGVISGLDDVALSIDFSPDGKQLAIVSRGELQLFDLSSGTKQWEIRYPDFGNEIGGFTATQWTTNDCVLVSGRYLVHAPTQSVIWKYAYDGFSAKPIGWFGDGMWYQQDDAFNHAATVVRKRIPTPEAMVAVKRVAKNPDYIYQEGSKVALEVDIDVPDREKIAEHLKKKLVADGVEVIDKAEKPGMKFVIDAKPRVVGGKIAKAGTVEINVHLMEGDKTLWSASIAKHPEELKGPTVEGESKASASKEFVVASGVEFPKRIIRYPEGKSYFGETELFPGRN